MQAEGKERVNYFYKIAFVTLLIVAVLLVANRYFYGTWNPYGAPSRINCFSRRYYPSIRDEMLTGKAKPVYLASVTQLFFGKRIYMQFPKGKYVPTVIYLQIRDNIYLPYTLSGGP